MGYAIVCRFVRKIRQGKNEKDLIACLLGTYKLDTIDARQGENGKQNEDLDRLHGWFERYSFFSLFPKFMTSLGDWREVYLCSDPIWGPAPKFIGGMSRQKLFTRNNLVSVACVKRLWWHFLVNLKFFLSSFWPEMNEEVVETCVRKIFETLILSTRSCERPNNILRAS